LTDSSLLQFILTGMIADNHKKKLEQYANQHLSQELIEVKNSNRRNYLNVLNDFEKAIIYK